MFFASRIASALISAARSTAAGVGREERVAGAAAEDNDAALFQMADRLASGCTAQRSCSSRWRSAREPPRRAAPGSPATASALMAVASMPMWSARVRSILPPPSFTPRQKLPPPTTMPISHARFDALLDHIAYRRPMTSKSRPAVRIARKGFAADLDQYALIFLCFHAPHSLFYSCLLFYPIFGEFATIYIVLYSGNFY